MDSIQLQAVADAVRVSAGMPRKYPNPKKGTHRIPSQGRVHAAVKGGHITEEEAVDLNPKYDPSRTEYNNDKARPRDPAKQNASVKKYKAKKKAAANAPVTQ
jgi:hypothetical protein